MGCWSLLGSGGRAQSGSPGRGLATAPPPPPASPSISFHSPAAIPGGVGLSTSSSTAPAAAPPERICPCQRQGPLQVGRLCSTPSTRGRDMAHRRSQRAQVATGSKRCWVLLASPSKLVPPVLSLSQPGSITSYSQTIRHGTKTGQAPDVRHGYGNTPLPQPYKVQMRGQASSSVTPPQLLASGPMSRGYPTQTQAGEPQNTAMPGEEGCC